MAEYIPHQPVIFSESVDGCLLNTNGFSMPVLLGDNTQFQFKIDGCASASDIVTDGSFASGASWSAGTNWTIASSRATHTAGASGNLYQAVPFTSSGFYKIIVTVVNMTAGTLQVKVGLTVKGTITANGTYEFFQAGPILGSGLTFVASSDFQGEITFASALVLTKAMKVIIYNANGTKAAILENADGYFSFYNQYWTTTIDWGTLGLSYGCYYIGIADECLNTCSQLFLAGQDFIQESFWTAQPNTFATLMLLNRVWLYEGTGNTSALLTANYELCAGRTYVITYTLAGHQGDAEFQLSLGATTGILRNANGTYTETIVAGGPDFNMSFGSTVNPSNFWVHSLSVVGIDAELTSDYYSNRFVYSPDITCTKMITAVCNENSFGMGFVNTGFIPRVRVDSKIVLSSYPQQRVKTRTSQGEKRVDYFESDKTWRLRILRQPEHIMDFLALLIGFDHWYIDNVEYFAAEDELGEPKPNKWFNLYDVDIECQKKTLLLVNKNCSGNVEEGAISQEQLTSSAGRVFTANGIQVVSYSRQ